MSSNPNKLVVDDFLKDISASPASNNLPVQTSPLIGREEELQKIIHLLSDPSCRLLTLVGPGGVGKTRLALRVAAESVGKFRDGVFLVPLVSVKSAEFLASSMATALKIPSFGQEDMHKQVLNYLREKEMLVMMDNFEHLLEEADWLVKVREEAPKVKFIVTSRESLGVRGEKVYEVRGLKIPTNENEADPGQFGSIQMFLHQARATQPDFQLTDKEKPSLVQLCKFLDGMPLGLELAAAWVKSLSIHEILGEMKKNSDFLVSTYGDLPERHRSLRAAFESSWNMVSANQKEILRKLAVFRADFRGDAAESITGAGVTPLTLLADKSILRKNAVGRFEVHSLLKQYLEEKLEEAPALKDEMRQKHCLYYADFMKERAGWLSGPRQKEALEAVGADIEDIRAAWGWAVEKRLWAEAEKFVEPLFHYYEIHGLYQEGEKVFGSGAQTFGDMVQKEGPAASKALRTLQGDLMARQGRFFYRLGYNEKATELLRSSLSILRKSGAGKQVAFAINHLSFVLSLISGGFEEGQKLLEQSVELCEREGDKPGLALSLKNLGYVNWRLGNYTEARQQLHRSQNLFTEMGDTHSLSVVLTEIVNLAYDQSRYEEAEELALQSLKVQKEIGDRSGAAWTQGKLGNVHWAMGNYEVAKKLYEQSLKIFKETGDREGMAWAANSVGHALKAVGNCLWAMECYREGLDLYEKVSHKWGIAWSLANKGHLECLLNYPVEAEKHLQESRQIFEEIANPWGTAYALDGLGQVAARLERWKDAEKYYGDALVLFKKSGNQREIALALCHLGSAALATQDRPRARQELLEALKTAVDRFITPVILNILLHLGVLDAEEDRMEKALETILFVLGHNAAEWEVREKAKAMADGLKGWLDAQKVSEIEARAKETQIHRMMGSYL